MRVPKRSRRPALQRLLGLAVSLICVAAVGVWISRQESPTWPDAAHLRWIAAALAVDSLTYTLRGWRWHHIMHLAGIAHRRADAFALTVVGYMGNNVLPARGGELLRIGLLGARTTARRREVLGSIVAERLLDAAVLIGLFAVMTFAGVTGAPTGKLPAAIAALGLLLAGVGLAGYLALRRRGRFEDFAARIRPVARASKLFARPEGLLVASVSAVIWVLQGTTFLLIGRSLGIHLGVLEACAVIVLASITALVPAAPGYVGTFDAGVAFGLHAAGVPGGAALGFILLVRVVMFVPVTLVGLVVLLARYRGLEAFARGRRDGDAAAPAAAPTERELAGATND